VLAVITKTDLAKKIRKSQRYVPECESGEQRLDAIELTNICCALGLNPGTVLPEVAPHIVAIARKASQKASHS
jgi:hypothetical protein